jgi:hypothetical protein
MTSSDSGVKERLYHSVIKESRNSSVITTVMTILGLSTVVLVLCNILMDVTTQGEVEVNLQIQNLKSSLFELSFYYTFLSIDFSSKWL